MDREDVERVVDLEPRAQQRGAVAQAADDETDDERPTDSDEAGGWRDGDEAGDGAARGPDDTDLALVEVAGEDPGDRRGRGGRVGDDEGVGGEAVGGDGGPGVEAEPAEPQEAGAQDRHRHVVRLHPIAVDDAPADEQGDDEGARRRS